jgi:hypothetical protein
VNGRMECPICKKDFKNVKIHFERIKKCGNSIDICNCLQKYEEYRKEYDRNRIRLKTENYRKKQKEHNYDAFELKPSTAEQKYKKKQKEVNPDAFKLKANATDQKYKKKQKDVNTDAFKLKHTEANQRYKKKKKENIDETARINNFNRAVISGPIFVCSCCSRQLYENGVTRIRTNWKEKLELKKPGFFHYCIPKEEHIDILLNGDDALSGSYICITCKTSMMTGKVPAMATINGLYIYKVEEDCLLIELENNLIAQNINFQYIFCLPKSR